MSIIGRGTRISCVSRPFSDVTKPVEQTPARGPHTHLRVKKKEPQKLLNDNSAFVKDITLSFHIRKEGYLEAMYPKN